MRQTILQQLPLVPLVTHRHAKELQAMSDIIAELAESVFRAVDLDLRQGARSDRGRGGLAAEQVVRMFVLKQMTQLSYERLSFALEDSMSYRAFCLLGAADGAPKRSTLADNIKRLKPETLQKIHQSVVQLGIDCGLEDGFRIGIDSTVIETHIHHPTDSSLLLDGVEKLTSLLNQARAFCSVHFVDHRKRAKRRALAICFAKSNEARLAPYKDLLRVVEFTLGYAKDAAKKLMSKGARALAEAASLAAKMEHFIELVTQVAAQTYRRVILGEQVPVSEKVVSIHEPHTDIIVKDNRDTYYGHKAFLTVSHTGLVLDLHVPRGNPNDATLTEPMVQSLADNCDITPEQAAFDGCFCSHQNLDALKELGVGDVAFTSPRGLSIEQMTGSKSVFQSLRRFRARIEGTIGWLKNTFGLRRCNFRGWDSFLSYAWGSTIAHNLLLLARITSE